ncbi:MAG TPA: TIM barrel protein [Terriglobales bacterium]|jgi:L-rhamnose isomerase/sugar isomerase|nr:TIM barrel protein [Terriglobales bacterium]
MTDKQQALIFRALDSFNIELPSWGFANTGTRFGKFVQAAAANTVEEKFSDAGQVHALTGACPTVALHVQWDVPKGVSQASDIKKLAEKYGVQPGSINPNVFQDQEYKYGSAGNPDPAIRKRAVDHMVECVAIADALNCRDISPWFADGSNYPGTQNMRKRIRWFEESLKEVHSHLTPKQRLLVEYKPFEPAFYHTDLADWGMAFLLARHAGPQAMVLVDTGHHYQAQNIEQIVAWLLHHDMMGGFHFNDRRYADDDLTLGSIDPYQIFRIFHEIHTFEWEQGKRSEIAYMVDQSHNLKGKMEAMIQTVCTAQELYAKAALVDHGRLEKLQESCSLVEAEETLRGSFWIDVRPVIQEWRASHGLPKDPMQAFHESGYLERITAERRERNVGSVTTYA